jgi:SAM-dependent methyltransferase
MKDKGITVYTGIDLPLEPGAAFEIVVNELTLAFPWLGIHFEAGLEGRVIQNRFEVGRIVAWEPGKRLAIEWRQASWEPEVVTEIEFIFEPTDGGTHLRLEHHRWGALIGNSGEIAGWFASDIATPFLHAMTPEALGDWITDRKARRPSGTQSRAYYGDPLYHYPNFRVIVSELALTPDDYLLEVGFGGGVLLKQALRSGCRAAGIDHSSDMLQLARELNRDAIREGRLKIFEASADLLPFPDATFTCAAMTGVLGFLPNPVSALTEIRRVLIKGGRLIALGSDPKMRGTPAAPEPMASHLRFYEDEELGSIAHQAGFRSVSVVHRDLEAYAREAGVPEEHLSLFAGGTPFLFARKE